MYNAMDDDCIFNAMVVDGDGTWLNANDAKRFRTALKVFLVCAGA